MESMEREHVMVIVAVFPHNLEPSILISKAEAINVSMYVDSSWVEVVASGNNTLGFDMQGLDTYF